MVRVKMRRLETSWLRSARHAGEGHKILGPPPSLVRVYRAQGRKSLRDFISRMQRSSRRNIIIPSSPTLAPSTSETSIPPETFGGFSSTTSSLPAGKTLYSEQFLSGLLCDRLRDMAKGEGITGYSKMRKADLVAALMGTNDV